MATPVRIVATTDEGPAFYATGRRGAWRDVRAVLHPPYTAWHLSYVVIGAMLAPRVNWASLGWTMLAFFLAVGVAAHALDEIKGRPLSTDIPVRVLWMATIGGLAGACALGVAAVATHRVSAWLLVFIVVGAVLVLAYNLELFNGVVHTDLGLCLSWGAFPVLTSYFAQTSRLTWSAAAAAGAAALFTGAQRNLSTPVRRVRRQVVDIDGQLAIRDGTRVAIDRQLLLGPSERALRCVSWAMMTLALSLVLVRHGL